MSEEWRHITPNATEELKLDGYRLEAVRRAGRTTVYSRRQNVLNRKFPHVVSALDYLPDGTVLDGELVALGPDGHPSFKLLQKFRSAESRIVYYAFDVLVHKNRDLTQLPLAERRGILHSLVEPSEHVAISEVVDGSAADTLRFVKEHRLEGSVGKRADSIYQPGQRTGLWIKHRINRSQEFVIGGYIPSNLGVDSLVVGFYRGQDLIYAARVRAGLVPGTRREVLRELEHLISTQCPFVNLPEAEAGRWGQGLTEQKMKECVWLRPKTVAQIEFLEWTGEEHLRHSKFVALQPGKNLRKIVRET